jgi:hypothetical protein
MPVLAEATAAGLLMEEPNLGVYALGADSRALCPRLRIAKGLTSQLPKNEEAPEWGPLLIHELDREIAYRRQAEGR